MFTGFRDKGTTCPKCNAFCGNPPQYDVTLESLLSLVYNHIGHQHPTAESSAVDPKAFEKLYGQRQATAIALQTAGELFVAASRSNDLQVRAFDSPKIVGPLGVAKDFGEKGDAISTPMEVEP